MVKEIEVPRAAATGRQRFLKFTLRKPVDFALVSVASAIEVKENVCVSARIVIGGVAPGPFRSRPAEEALVGQKLDAAAAERAAEVALKGARPLRKNGYKIEIAKALVKRAIRNN
jgi:xanthine dehydrogenase YagS FAD-binding subunit